MTRPFRFAAQFLTADSGEEFTAFYLSQAGCDLDRMAQVVERLAGR